MKAVAPLRYGVIFKKAFKEKDAHRVLFEHLHRLCA
jgi:hypothetical protein